MGRVSGISTSFSPLPAEGKNKPRLDASPGHSLMWYKPSRTSSLSMHTDPMEGSAITTTLMRRSNAHPYCMVDSVAIGK